MKHPLTICTAATACEVSDDARKFASQTGRRILQILGVLFAGAILTLAAGGCGGSNMIHIEDMAQFQQVVVQSKQPVMVEFYKLGCPTCGAIEPALDQMADEYRGRATFASFKLMEPYFVVTNWDIQKQYDIALLFPTVILFVDGQAKQRWILDYNMDGYRKALDAVVVGPAKAPAKP